MENPPDSLEKEEATKTGQQSDPVGAFPEDMKSIIFKGLGITEEDMENILYFAEKVNEEATRKRQEFARVENSVDFANFDMMDVYGGQSMNKQKQFSVDFPVASFPVLDFFVPKKQRRNRAKHLMGTTGASLLNKVENPVMGDLETRFSDAEQFKVKRVPGNGETLEINGAVSFKKFGIPVLKDVETGSSDAEDKRKCQKRCLESGESEEPKRQKVKIQNNRVMAKLAEWGLEPPPNLPIEFKKLIRGMGGVDEKLLIQKIIFKTDLSKTHNRLQIPVNQVMTDFLTEEEGRKLDNKEEGLDVLLIEPCLKKSTIHLTRWNMRSSKVYVFNKQWMSVVEGNSTLKENAVVQIWSYRTAPKSDLCFAMVNVKDGDDC